MISLYRQAYFSTPFVRLGIVPEAGSSYLFPLIFGRSMATEILLFGHRLSAQDAFRYNFVSRIYKSCEFNEMVWKPLMKFANQPMKSMLMSKKLMRHLDKKSLLMAIEAECEALEQCLQSEEFIQTILQFSQRKSKL